jgi:hypothetical protein
MPIALAKSLIAQIRFSVQPVNVFADAAFHLIRRKPYAALVGFRFNGGNQFPLAGFHGKPVVFLYEFLML